MLWVPCASCAVEQVAVPKAPRGTDGQPMDAPLSLKLTVPVGALPATEAVNVTMAPTVAGFAELANVVVVVPGALPPPALMTSESVVLDVALAAFPP